MDFYPHSQRQEDVIFAKERMVVAATGIQWGKSHSGVMWLKRMMHTYTDKSDNFIVTSPTFKIMNQSTYPVFKELMGSTGTYNGKDDAFRMRGGGTAYFRTGTDPDSVVGITNVRAILCDEAGKYSKYFWENIQGRSSFYQAPLRIVTSPYSQNWLFKEIILPKTRDPSCLPNVRLIQATSKDNPYFPAAEFDEKRRTMDPRRFAMIYGGQFQRMEGLVYDCFDDDLNSAPASTEFPLGTEFFGGIDWGYTEPFALVVHAITPKGRRYQVSEVKKSRLTLPEIGEICLQKMRVLGVKRFYGGPDQPGAIEFLNRLGVPTVAANNDIRRGVDAVYEELNTRNFKLLKGSSPHTLDEFETYHYPEPKDLRPDQDGKEMNPVGQNDHVADAIRYLVISTRTIHEKHKPTNPGRPKIAHTEKEKIAQLTRPRKRNVA